MRKKLHLLLLFIAIFFCFGINCNANIIFAQTNNYEYIENDDYRLDSDYLDFYAISSKYFSYTNNGGELSSNKLSYAFDRDFSTSFKSAQDNNVTYVDPEDGETKSNFINTIDVTFSSNVTLNRIIYASENGMTRGYPTNLNIYYKNGDEYVLINNYQTIETTKFVVFEFGKDITLTQFRFEYVKVSTNHKYVATAKEIIFLQPENDDYTKYQNLFTDYTQTTLNSEYNTFSKVEELENSLRNNINFVGENEKINRAKQVALGQVFFNPKQEFSTDQTSQNIINQYGDIAGYCRNNLQMSSFGTNRQVTGLLAYAGQEVTIYVTANEGDPLPRIRFSQHMGSWRKWLGGEQQLKLGKNTFTVPNFKHDDYTIDVPLGGPIYISNPYTSLQQSSNVKIYIEGGSFYPVLDGNTNEKEYLFELQKYSEYVATDPQNIIDVTEIVADHIIVTVNATRANEIYQSFSPSQTIENWNNFMDKLLEFGGVTQDVNNELFNEKNLNVTCNIRIVQPWSGGWMFAASEHVGVRQDSQNGLIYCSNLGWGVAHELGHMFDNVNRTIGETTNNMWAKFNETAIEQANSRGDFTKTTNALANDLTYNDTSYFNLNRYNFLVWWYLESWQKGFWGNLENCYRGVYPKIQEFWQQNPTLKTQVNQLSKDEIMVFYSSIATGVDLGYYFDRWGFSFTAPSDDNSDPKFELSSTSQLYKDFMSTAISNGLIDNTKQYKLWYQTNMAYHNTNTTPTYSNDTIVSIKSVTKTSTGYNIFINHITNQNHLGYEILQGDETNGYKVIGFTYGNAFTDTTQYSNDYTPSYKIVAIDNTFNNSKTSEAKTITQSSKVVCKIGTTDYTSLALAVSNAQANDVIELLTSFDTSNITIDKNLTITIASSVSDSITITKIESGHMFTILQGVTLNLRGLDGKMIILDGNSFSQNGALISLAGVINAEYVKFSNSISAGNGGAIVMQGGSQGSNFANCQFNNNQANNGVVYYCDYANSNATFSNCVFDSNTAQNDGIIASKGTLTLNNCQISNNTCTNNGTIKNYAGGIVNINNCTISNNQAGTGAGLHIDGYSNIQNSSIFANTATQNAGGIYYSTNVAVRQLILENVQFSNNISPLGGDLVVSNGKATLGQVTTTINSKIQLLSGEIRLKNTCNLSSEISITPSVNLILVNGLFENIGETTFSLINFESGSKVLSSDNYTLLAQDVTKFNLQNDNFSLQLNDNAIYVNAKNITLTTIINGITNTEEYSYGEVVELNFNYSQTQYISKYVDSDTNEYLPGEKLTITNNLTLTATIASKIKVDFVYGDLDKQTFYYIPYQTITLPTAPASEHKLLGWKNSQGYYVAGDKIILHQDTNFVAQFEQLLKLSLYDGENVLYEGYYEYGEEVDLSQIDIAQPDFWLDGETKINTAKIISNISLQAGYNANNYMLIIVICVIICLLIICIILIAKKIKNKIN